ncbi:glutamate racemase [Prolixibacteraceae bacterium JC049]|nr:glutamate racemase [Prolixibacteraceae bacterium JC049]
MKKGAIGIFDSGYGGLTILKEIVKALPDYDYIYLGDNARTPYGTRSFDVVYEYTLQAVKQMFDMGCHLVILACNTASAKALRSIQQKDLPNIDPTRRVLGVIRPSVEEIPNLTESRSVGIMATLGTVSSLSYPLEIEKLNNGAPIKVTQEACPMWVPIVENKEIDTEGADYFIQKNVNQLLQQSPDIDTIVLACTHYPLLAHRIRKFLPANIQLIEQGSIVADKLIDYLQRHPEMEEKCSKEGSLQFYTTEKPATFNDKASFFMGTEVEASQLRL